LQLLINNELEYAVAYVNLSPEERRLADNLTMVYRQRLITQAGGSIERARRKAQEEGLDFDDKVREEYRTNVVRIYYQKRVFPRVQVSASDMRMYYERNIQKLFSTRDQAQFRVIRIARTSGGDSAADRAKIEQLHQRAKAGEDFAELAGAFNDDPILLRNRGDVGLLDRGAYRVAEVEEAVWKLQSGEVTDIIETRDGFYIARLEQKNVGTIRPFEDPEVQMEILETLRREQFNTLRAQEQDKLRRNAIIHPANPSIEPILEMAMQQYPRWRE
jgi:parvulin-like peptidyl-prolyl isomerase